MPVAVPLIQTQSDSGDTIKIQNNRAGVSNARLRAFKPVLSRSRRMEENMRASIAHATGCLVRAGVIACCVAGVCTPAHADVITDWDENAGTIVMPMPPYNAQRLMGMVNVAMFDAVNSIARRYRPLLAQLPA